MATRERSDSRRWNGDEKNATPSLEDSFTSSCRKHTELVTPNNGFRSDKNDPFFASIDATPLLCMMMPLKIFTPGGSHLFCLHGQLTWDRT